MVLLFFLIFLVMGINLSKPRNINELIAILIISVPIIILIIIILLAILNLAKTTIILSNYGIRIKSLFKNKLFQWNDIADIKRIYVLSGAFPVGGPPRDLQLIAKNGKTFKILFFIKSSNNVDEGIDSIEIDIKKVINAKLHD